MTFIKQVRKKYVIDLGFIKSEMENVS